MANATRFLEIASLSVDPVQSTECQFNCMVPLPRNDGWKADLELALEIVDRKQKMHQWAEKAVQKLMGSRPKIMSSLDALPPGRINRSFGRSRGEGS